MTKYLPMANGSIIQCSQEMFTPLLFLGTGWKGFLGNPRNHRFLKWRTSRGGSGNAEKNVTFSPTTLDSLSPIALNSIQMTCDGVVVFGGGRFLPLKAGFCWAVVKASSVQFCPNKEL